MSRHQTRVNKKPETVHLLRRVKKIRREIILLFDDGSRLTVEAECDCANGWTELILKAGEP